MASLYLLRRRRGLREACREIMAAHGRQPPCQSCGLGDICRRSLGGKLSVRKRVGRRYPRDGPDISGRGILQNP